MITQIIIKQKVFLLAIGIFIAGSALAQKDDFYVKSIKAYQKNYIDSHDVVKNIKDKKAIIFT